MLSKRNQTVIYITKEPITMSVEIKREDAIHLLSQKGVTNDEGQECLYYPTCEKWTNERLAAKLIELPDYEGLEEETEIDDVDAMATYGAVFEAYNEETTIEVVGDDGEIDNKPAKAKDKKSASAKPAKAKDKKPTRAEDEEEEEKENVKDKKARIKAETAAAKAKNKKTPTEKKAPTEKKTTATPKKPRKEKGVSLVDAAAQLLKESKTAMTCTEMVDELEKRKIYISQGATPDRSLSTAIIHEMRGDTSVEKPRFVRVDRGLFTAPGVKYTPPKKDEPEEKTKGGKKASAEKDVKAKSKKGAKPSTTETAPAKPAKAEAKKPATKKKAKAK